MKENIGFYMGYSPPFNGENYKNRKVYGSEITTIKLAESLSDLYNVFIFIANLNNNEEIIYNNVNYVNKNKLVDFELLDLMILNPISVSFFSICEKPPPPECQLCHSITRNLEFFKREE